MDNELEFAKKLAHEAGGIMHKYFNQTDISHYKGDNTIVTTADIEINQLVIDRVRERYPDHGVYGEEDSFGRDKSILWVCDPIDGTRMFACGIPTAAFSLALVIHGEPVIGVIYNPRTDRLYHAVKGQGAFCNDKPIHVNDITFESKKAISHFDIRPGTELFVKMSGLINKLISKTYLVSIGSCVNASTQIACGSFVAGFYPGTKCKNVDVAAAKIIIEEAGGRVTNFYGEEQRYDQDIKGVIMSNGVVHEEILQIIREVQ